MKELHQNKKKRKRGSASVVSLMYIFKQFYQGPNCLVYFKQPLLLFMERVKKRGNKRPREISAARNVRLSHWRDGMARPKTRASMNQVVAGSKPATFVEILQ